MEFRLARNLPKTTRPPEPQIALSLQTSMGPVSASTLVRGSCIASIVMAVQPRISDYGLIGNCRTAALISSSGSIDWCCLPRFDSKSIFGAILDPAEAGRYSIHPVGAFKSRQSYADDTNVLETRFETNGSRAVLLDFFAVNTEAEKKDRLVPDHEILRIIRGEEGVTRFRLRFRPRLDYGKTRAEFQKRGQWAIAFEVGSSCCFFRSSLNPSQLAITDDGIDAEFTLSSGEQHEFSLSHSAEAPAVLPVLGPAAQKRLHETLRFWKTWIARCSYQGHYSEHVKRSALALKLLAFAPSGAIVAAPTTSLPECLGGERNWDYRYCWLRDASFTVRALSRLGFEEDARAFVSWMLHATRLSRPELKVLYSIYGDPILTEAELPFLGGYSGSRPVRVGNAASEQFQLDVYGEVLDAVEYASRSMESFDSETRNFITDLGKAVVRFADQTDDGIWEDRTARAHHTHSKVLSWVALDRLIRISRRFGWTLDLQKIQTVKENIGNEIEKHGYSAEENSYIRTYGGQDLDASALQFPLFGYCDAASARMRATCHRIEERLGQNGLIFRYRDVNDGLRGQEGAFVACTFWMAEVLARSGELERAQEYFENALRFTNPVGLWSEEIDPGTREFLGNYPQAFSHVGLINAAHQITRCSKNREAA